MTTYKGALPRPTPETQPYWDGLKEHKLVLPYCAQCRKFTFYPRPFCRHCFSWNIEWRPLSGKAKLHTYVISHRPPPGWEDRAPYVIGVFELAEGERMLSNLLVDGVPDPAKIPVDLDCQIVYQDVSEEITLPAFRPA